MMQFSPQQVRFALILAALIAGLVLYRHFAFV